MLRRVSNALRLRWAAVQLRRGNYDGAQALFVSVINGMPRESALLAALAGSAEAEFWCGRFLNARYYAGQYIERAGSDPELTRTDSGRAQLAKMHRYHATSQQRHQQFGRRRDPPVLR